MAVLSSLVVQLALESASFQQGLRSARTELKTFSREAGQVARVGRDFSQAARSADGLARAVGAVDPQLGNMASTAIATALAVRGLGAAFVFLTGPIGLAVGLGLILGGVINKIAGSAIAAIPGVDQLGTVLAGMFGKTPTKAVNEQAKIQVEAMGKAFAKQAEGAARLKEELTRLGAEFMAIQATSPARVAAIEAEASGDRVRALQASHDAAVATLNAELATRLAGLKQFGQDAAVVEKERAVAVAQWNAQILEAEARLVAERQKLYEAFAAETLTILTRLGAGFEDATQRLTIDVALRRAQQELRSLQEILGPEELRRAIFRISEELLTLGATSAQVTALLGDDFARFAASVAPIPADIKALAVEAQTLGTTTGAVAAPGITAMNQALATTAATAAAATVGLVAVTAAALEAARAASGFSSSTQGFFGGEVQLPSTGGGFSPGTKLPSEGGGFFPGSRRFEHGGVVPGSPSRAVPILAHGGETIVPAGESAGAPIIHFSFNAPLFVDNDRRMRALALKLWEHIRDAQRRHAR